MCPARYKSGYHVNASFTLYTLFVLFFVPKKLGQSVFSFAGAEEDQQYGGRDISAREYQWFTVIRRAVDSKFLCSGAMIGSRHVLTANHCLDNVGSSYVEVGYLCRQRNNCFRQNDFVPVRNLYRHPTGGDLALVELQRATRFFSPFPPAVPYMGASIHPSQLTLKKGRKMKMIGAGRAGTGDEISAYAKELDVKYLPPKRCRKKLKDSSRVTETVVCSVAQNGNPCAGDSGSALVVAGKGKWKGRDVIVAVHSFGPFDCSDARDDQPLGHFRITDAADLLQSIICEGDYPEDWCPEFSLKASNPTHSPTRAPSVDEPTNGNPMSPTPGAGFLPAGQLRGSLVHTLQGHANVVRSISFNSDGSRLVSGSYDATIKVWNPLLGGSALSTFIGHTTKVFSVRWNPSDTVIASASETPENSVRLWEADNPDASPIELLPKHTLSVNALAWHPEGTYLASGSSDNTIKMWNAVTYEETRPTRGGGGSIQSLSFHPDGAQLAEGSSGTIGIFSWHWRDPVDSNMFHRLTRDITWRQEVAFSPDGNFLASAAWDDLVRVWDLHDRSLKHELSGHLFEVYSVAWSPSGKFLVSGSKDNSVMVWDAENGGEALLVLEGHHSDDIWSVDWSPDGVHLASGSGDSTIKIWKIETV